jgi:sec-independent protein translocase protein TatB
MFDIGFSELLVIAVVALLVIGPERLPKVARTTGHLLGRLQRYVNDVKSDIQREFELDELRKLRAQIEDAAHSVQQSVAEVDGQMRSVTDDLSRSIQNEPPPAPPSGETAVPQPPAPPTPTPETPPHPTTPAESKS